MGLKDFTKLSFAVRFAILGVLIFSYVNGFPAAAQQIESSPATNSDLVIGESFNAYTGDISGLHYTQPKQILPRAKTRELEARLGAATSAVDVLAQNGPSTNRVDLVIVGDGYTADQLPAFRNITAGLFSHLFSSTPYNQYRNYFNVYRVDVTSNESGVDGDPSQGTLRDTAFDSRFWCNGIERLLCFDPSKARAAAVAAPGSDHVMILANTAQYGGAAMIGIDVVSIAAHNPYADDVTVHEYSHVVGRLSDEYDNGGPTNYPYNESTSPNSSTLNASSMAAQSKKWFSWLGYDGGGEFDGVIGTYQGSEYSPSGVYRPSQNSKMRQLYRPFNLPSIEAIIVEIYKKVKPIDAGPANGATLTSGQVVSLSVLQPVNAPLSVKWFLDGVELTASEGSLTFATGDLPASGPARQLRVVVKDLTPFVRNETLRTTYLTETRNWTVPGTDPLTATPTPSATPREQEVTPTRTATPTATATATRTATRTATAIPTVTLTPTPTSTRTPTVVATSTSTRTATPTSTATSSPTMTKTPGPTNTSTPTPTARPTHSPTPAPTISPQKLIPKKLSLSVRVARKTGGVAVKVTPSLSRISYAECPLYLNGYLNKKDSLPAIRFQVSGYTPSLDKTVVVPFKVLKSRSLGTDGKIFLQAEYSCQIGDLLLKRSSALKSVTLTGIRVTSAVSEADWLSNFAAQLAVP